MEALTQRGLQRVSPLQSRGAASRPNGTPRTTKPLDQSCLRQARDGGGRLCPAGFTCLDRAHLHPDSTPMSSSLAPPN